MRFRLFAAATALLLGIDVYAVFFVARPDRVQGDAARIVYLHVPLAWVAFLAFFVVFAVSVAYLVRRAPTLDRIGRSSAEVGLVFTTLVLVTGSIWGYPIWGTWWSWDPKLTTTLILWFIYLGYLMVRSYAEPPRGPQYAAIVGVVGFVDVPIVYLSSVWWRTLHPQPVLGPLAEQQPAAPILVLLAFSVVAFTALYLLLTWLRILVQSETEVLAEVRASRLDSGESSGAWRERQVPPPPNRAGVKRGPTATGAV